MNTTVELAHKVIEMENQIMFLKRENEDLRLKAAMYKTMYFHRFELSEKLSDQITRNIQAKYNGEFNGFCYYYDPTAEYLTLEDMVERRLISTEEYSFCTV